MRQRSARRKESPGIDPVTLEVIQSALVYAAEEAGIALRNAAYSHNIKERMDHSCALFDAEGRLLAQAEHIPVHLGSLPWGVKNVLRWVATEGRRWEPGDAVMVNDPYIAGTHLNDVMILKPVFYRRRLIGFSVNRAHHVDVGGRVVGSISPDARSLEDEGVIVPPIWIARRDAMDEKALLPFLSSVRAPEISEGDLRAQLAAAALGERRLMELASGYGFEMLQAGFSEIIASGRRRMIRHIGALPGGVFAAEDCLEDVNGEGTLSRIRVTLEKRGDTLKVDFTGTEAQLPTPFNAVFGVTLSATYFAVKSVLDPEGPMNEGVLEPVWVLAPSGCLVHPVKPAPVAGGNLETSQRIADTVLRALARVWPQRVPAAPHGCMNNVSAGGYDPGRKRIWAFYETIGGGAGARPGSDGVSGIHTNMTNTMNTPIEAIEQSYPVLFERYELREGSRGAGRWRGGEGIIRAWRLIGPSAEVTVIGDRHRVRPWGLAGGEGGIPGAFFIRQADGLIRRLKSKETVPLREGDTLIIETPGGGGYGNPAASEGPSDGPVLDGGVQ